MIKIESAASVKFRSSTTVTRGKMIQSTIKFVKFNYKSENRSLQSIKVSGVRNKT